MDKVYAVAAAYNVLFVGNLDQALKFMNTPNEDDGFSYDLYVVQRMDHLLTLKREIWAKGSGEVKARYLPGSIREYFVGIPTGVLELLRGDPSKKEEPGLPQRVSSADSSLA